MALAATLTLLEGLPEAIKAEYKKGEDGVFTLDVTGGEDTGALKRAKEHEKAARQEAERKAQELADKLEKATGEVTTLQEEMDEIHRGNVSKGDVEKLEASWQRKLETQAEASKATIESLNGSMNTLLVDNVAQSIASEISISPDLIMPHLRSRLRAEIVDGNAVTKVVDSAGAPSALTVQELAEEFRANEKFAPIIVGSKASGSGAGQGKGGGGATGGKPLDYSKATPAEIAADIAAKKES